MNQAVIMSEFHSKSQLNDAVIDRLHVLHRYLQCQIESQTLNIRVHEALISELSQLKLLSFIEKGIQACNDISVRWQVNPTLQVFVIPNALQRELLLEVVVEYHEMFIIQDPSNLYAIN